MQSFVILIICLLGFCCIDMNQSTKNRLITQEYDHIYPRSHRRRMKEDDDEFLGSLRRAFGLFVFDLKLTLYTNIFLYKGGRHKRHHRRHHRGHYHGGHNDNMMATMTPMQQMMMQMMMMKMYMHMMERMMPRQHSAHSDEANYYQYDEDQNEDQG